MFTGIFIDQLKTKTCLRQKNVFNTKPTVQQQNKRFLFNPNLNASGLHFRGEGPGGAVPNAVWRNAPDDAPAPVGERGDVLHAPADRREGLVPAAPHRPAVVRPVLSVRRDQVQVRSRSPGVASELLEVLTCSNNLKAPFIPSTMTVSSKRLTK